MTAKHAQRSKGQADRALHERIRADMTDLILSGTWKPGHRIPYEHEIMVQYDCARMTVNKAMVALVEAGLIERRRRAGSFVRQPGGQAASLLFFDLSAEVIAMGAAYGYSLLTSQKQDRLNDANRFADAQDVKEELVLHCLHLADGKSFCAEERRFMLDAVPDAAFAPFVTLPPDRWLRENVAWHEIENRISAIAADQDIARLLGLKEDEPVLRIERVHRALGQLLSSATFWFRADMYQPVARFDPSFMK